MKKHACRPTYGLEKAEAGIQRRSHIWPGTHRTQAAAVKRLRTLTRQGVGMLHVVVSHDCGKSWKRVR